MGINGAQYGEDAILQSFFDGQEEGYLVDLGAANGRANSNSVRLLERDGWSGLLVEPEPEQFAALDQLYIDKPWIARVNCAVAAASGFAPFYVCEQVSTLLPSWKKNCIERHGVDYSEIEVEVRNVNELLKAQACPKDIDFLSIDCEGMDRQIIQAWDFSLFQPQLVCLEGFGFILPGYKEMCKTNGNSFYVRTD